MNNYEQKYNKLVESIKKLQEANPSDEGIQNWVNDNVPELQESEDERIRKVLVELVKCNERCGYFMINNTTTSSMLAWLEKQGKQKPATIDIDKMVDDYANNKERGNEEFGKPVNCMIRAYRQGLNDAIGKVVLKPWSEEDERICRTIITDIANDKSMCKFEISKGICDEQINWLKSLKQRIGG